MQDLYDQIAEKIVAQQELVIGPIAIERAKEVSDLNIDWNNHTIGVKGDPKRAIDHLVGQYEELFGQVAVDTCREATNKYIAQLSPDQIPQSLR